MSEKSDTLLNLINGYGLSREEGKIYLYLLHHSFTTALTLSRHLKISRTKIYRLLDTLKEKQLVEQRIEDRGMQFGATHPQKFHQLLVEKEQQVKVLKRSLPVLLPQLEALIPSLDHRSKVLYYSGVEGLKQVSYNLTKTKGSLRVFEMEHLSDFLPEDFSERVRRKLVQNNIFTRDLTNKPSFPSFTKVVELIKHFSEFRYVDPSLLTIEFEVLIYNNVYATYTYKDEQMFCVEIYNDQLAAMQKQIFDFIWHQAVPMRFINNQGQAEVDARWLIEKSTLPSSK